MAANTTNKTVVRVTAIIRVTFFLTLIAMMITIGYSANNKGELKEYVDYKLKHTEFDIQSLDAKVNVLKEYGESIQKSIDSLRDINKINRRDISNIQYRINRFDEELTAIFD